MKKFLDVSVYEQRISKEKKEKFDAFKALLIEYNARFNLTSVIDDEGIFYKHFLDSSAAADLMKKDAFICEVGSGAGFPSIVLKILRDDLSFSLVESVGKKCEFLRAVVDKLGLSNMHIFNIRAEEMARDSKHRDRYDYAVARAVARMNSLCEYCMPFVKKGGKFIAYKSGDLEEISEAESAYKALGGELEDVFLYSLPKNFGERSLVVVKKVKNTPERYPRGQGKERKNPL